MGQTGSGQKETYGLEARKKFHELGLTGAGQVAEKCCL
ncbi:unnamed protein product, partial [Didymodactylos carnosus]